MTPRKTAGEIAGDAAPASIEEDPAPGEDASVVDDTPAFGDDAPSLADEARLQSRLSSVCPAARRYSSGPSTRG